MTDQEVQPAVLHALKMSRSSNNRGRMAEWDQAETAAWRVPGGKRLRID